MNPRILCVDDDTNVLESLRDSLRRRFDVVGCTNGFEALKMLVAERFPVVISDMRMPLIDGARFLKLAREHAPETVRILLTGQSTLDEVVATVNDGQIFRFLLKPCPTPDLVAAIDAAIAHHKETRRPAAHGFERRRGPGDDGDGGGRRPDRVGAGRAHPAHRSGPLQGAQGHLRGRRSDAPASCRSWAPSRCSATRSRSSRACAR